MSNDVSRLLAECQAAWRDHNARVTERLEREANSQASAGRARSSALLAGYSQIYCDALEEAKQLCLTRIALLPKPRVGWLRERAAARLSRAALSEIDTIAAGYESRLSAVAAGIGLPALAPNLRNKMKAISETLRPEVRRALEADHPILPWYQRPLGILVLGILASLLVTLAMVLRSSRS